MMALGLGLGLPFGGSAAVVASIPATQTVSFGAKTRVGFGGKPLGYVGAGTLAITGTNAAHWQIDNRYHLVPKNGAGAYGSAPPTFSGPYTLTIGDGVVSSTVTVNMVAAKAHFREMASTPGGVNQDNSAANTPFGPPYASQLNYYTDIFVLADGDHLVMRDGHFNPAGLVWYVNYHASYAGLSLTVESETVDVALNSDGNQRWAHGGKIGAILHNPATSGGVYPIEFKHLQFTNDSGLTSIFQQASDQIIRGLKLTNCFVGFGLGTTADIYGNSANGVGCDSTAVSGCRITNVACGYIGRASKTYPGSLTSNVFHHNWIDNININSTGWTITDNFIFDTVGPVAGHPDCMQLSGTYDVGDATDTAWATITGNIAVCDTGAATQGIGFLTNQGTAGTYVGLVFENNISVMCGLNGLQLSGMDNMFVRFNTIIGDQTRYNSGVNFTVTSGAPVSNNATIDRNVANIYAIGTITGTVVDTNRVTLAANLTAMDVMYPNLRAALIAGITNRAAAIVAATPAATAQASGGALLADGSYGGALKADGTLNRGVVATTLDATFITSPTVLITPLQVQRQTSAAHTVARATKAIPSPGACWEARADGYAAAGFAMFGVGDSTLPFALGSAFAGDDTHGGGVYMSAASYYNAANTGITGWANPITAGTWLTFCFITATKKLHVYHPTYGWDASGAGVIATDTGGLSMASLGATVYPIWSMVSINDEGTFNFGATAFSNTTAYTDCVSAGYLALQNA